jgi:glucokinase
VDVIGVDVGGTSVKAMRAGLDGTAMSRDSVATPQTAAALTASVVDLVERLRGADTVGVGVACPGDVRDGIVHFAANLPWREEPVLDRVQTAVRLPVAVEWDVAAAAIAESARVAADDVLFVSLGTGIACAHVVHGTVHRGATGRAGEIGHTPVRPDGDPCACGQRGCLEAYASAAAIARRYSARTGAALTAKQIAGRLDDDDDAAAVWSDAVAALATALVTETLVTDPGVIVLGGGLAEAGDRLLEPVRAAVTAGLAWRPAPPVLPASLGDAAGLHGATQRAWQVVPHAVSSPDREGCSP